MGDKPTSQNTNSTSTSTSTTTKWRTLSASDMPALMHIANTLHTTLPEREAVFHERTVLFPAGCLGLFDTSNNNNNNDDNDNNNDKLVGYLISHPIKYRQLPELDTLLGGIAPDAEQYYIHDLAILPGYRGGGRAHDVVRKVLEEVAKGYESVGLVSVYGTGAFWARFGFEGVEGVEGVEERLKEKLRGYGEDAVYLERKNA